MNNAKTRPSTKISTSQRSEPDRPAGHRELPNPLFYDHAFVSMERYAQLLALRYECNRTRHAYYRQLGLLQRHFGCDPAVLTEHQLREYVLFIKFEKRWKPGTIRQAVACFRAFFLDLLQRGPWEIFSQVRTRDEERLPVVLTREQVRELIGNIRLGRYRTPIKLIYCCGLRLSECLSLTIHDIPVARHDNRGGFRRDKMWG